MLFAVAVSTAGAARAFVDSPHTEPIPNDPCDVVVSATMALSPLLVQTIADPENRVICVAPGDYRAAGRINLVTSGTEESRRILRFNASDGVRNAAGRVQRATFEGIYIAGDWWVIQGLTIKPRVAANSMFVSIVGGDHNVIEGNLIDGSQHPNTWNNAGVVIGGSAGDPATYNTVQGNLIQYGDHTKAADDYFGILIGAGHTATEANDFNKVLDNEIVDWGDGVALGGVTSDCTEGAVQHGTIIDGNDVYITAAKRVDCTTGASDANGECACAENGIDLKSDPGPQPELWTRVTNNRVWGFRPTTTAASCGGSGSNGQAISSGSACPGHTFVARNVVTDSTIGISVAGPSWIVAGNLIHDIRMSNGKVYMTQAISPAPSASNLQIQFNTIVGSDNAYDDQSATTNTRCNVVVDDEAMSGAAGFRGASHSTEYNYLYRAQQPNFQGNTNEFYGTEAESGDAPYCYWRRRWSTPEVICIPFAATTPTSTHYAAAAQCDGDLGAPFGMDSVSFVAAPEPDATALGLAGLLAAAALARRRTHR